MCCRRYCPRLPVPMKPYWTWSFAARTFWIAGPATTAAAAPAVRTKSLRETSWSSAISDSPILHKVVFYLLKKAFLGGLVLDRQRFAQFLEQLSLGPVQLARHLHVDVHEKVSAPVTVDVGHTLAANAELRARLRAFGNFQTVDPVQSRDFELH